MVVSINLMRKDIIVLGLGNPLMSDEGIGGFVIEELAKAGRWGSEVEFVDGGTAGMSVLHLLAGRKKAIIVDCAFMGTVAGTIKKFGPEDVVSVKKMAHQSLHDVDILKVIAISERMGERPGDIIIFGIEPEKVEARQGISQALSSRVDEYIAEISKEL